MVILTCAELGARTVLATRSSALWGHLLLLPMEKRLGRSFIHLCSTLFHVFELLVPLQNKLNIRLDIQLIIRITSLKLKDKMKMWATNLSKGLEALMTMAE